MNKYFIVGMIVGLLILGAIIVTENNYQPPIEKKAKVLTPFGCLETIVSQDDFHKQQWFTDNVLGGHFIECDG